MKEKACMSANRGEKTTLYNCESSCCQEHFLITNESSLIYIYILEKKKKKIIPASR